MVIYCKWQRSLWPFSARLVSKSKKEEYRIGFGNANEASFPGFRNGVAFLSKRL
jgi:hypothetical protein